MKGFQLQCLCAMKSIQLWERVVVGHGDFNAPIHGPVFGPSRERKKCNFTSTTHKIAIGKGLHEARIL
eukprot:5514710-Amphidinium_carterae.1